MLRKFLVASLLAVAMAGASVAYQPVPAPGNDPPVKLTCVLAEGTELDGSAGFWIPFTYNGQGVPRCAIFNGDNPAQYVAASPLVPLGEVPGWYYAEFRGQFNLKSAMVFGYIGTTTSNTVKGKIVNNPLP